MKPNIQTLIISTLLLTTTSCSKNFLDMKADQRQVVPQTLDDFQAIMDQTIVMNEVSSSNFALIGGDEYYVTQAQLNTIAPGNANDYQKNAYIWADQIYLGKEPAQIDWNAGYNHIMIANLGAEKAANTTPTPAEQEKWNLLRGNTLFFRALNFFQLAQIYCTTYDGTASQRLGLPLRLDADPTLKVPRSNLEVTYQQILSDLNEAETLLPNLPVVLFRPSKAALYALRTRVYMQMGDYVKARQDADRCLAISNKLINFNSLTFTGNFTFPLHGANNDEIIFMNNAYSLTLLSSANSPTSLFNADTVLLKSYETGDLRINAYWFQNGTRKQFKGSYKGNVNYFTGFATDEVYLNRAECLARENKPADALADLNKLRQNRYTPAAYIALNSTDPQQVLDWVIAERKKELVMRGTRWEDLRRLNKEPRYATTVVRILGTTRYELKPGENKWTWPLPVEAIQNGKYEQNPR